MLHYIVFLYVCNVALEVFHSLLGQGHGGGTGLHWGTGTGAQRGAEDSARSVTRGASGGSVLFTRGGRAGLGKGPASDALARWTQESPYTLIHVSQKEVVQASRWLGRTGGGITAHPFGGGRAHRRPCW